MAIEIVDLPTKKWWFSIRVVMLVYQRVLSHEPSTHDYPALVILLGSSFFTLSPGWWFCDDTGHSMKIFGNPERNHLHGSHYAHNTHIIYMVSFLNLYGHPGVGQNILTTFEIFSKIPYSLQDDYRICPNTWCQDGCPADPSRWFVEPWTYYPYHKAQVQVCT